MKIQYDIDSRSTPYIGSNIFFTWEKGTKVCITLLSLDL